MSTTEAPTRSSNTSAGKVDMKLEVQIIPVSDVDRSKESYERLGWRLDRDAAPLEGLRIVQFTPPGLGDLGHVRPAPPRPRQARPRGSWSSPTSRPPVTSSSAVASR